MSATDVDGDRLDLFAIDLIDNTNLVDHGDGTGEFQFFPMVPQFGEHLFHLIVSDGFLADTLAVTVTVFPINLPPEWDPVNDTTARAGDSLVVKFMAIDPDGDFIVLAQIAPLLNSSFTDDGDGTGELRFYPDES